jgi:hypothetical protein
LIRIYMLPLTTLQQRGEAGGGHKIICPKIKIFTKTEKVYATCIWYYY